MREGLQVRLDLVALVAGLRQELPSAELKVLALRRAGEAAVVRLAYEGAFGSEIRRLFQATKMLARTRVGRQFDETRELKLVCSEFWAMVDAMETVWGKRGAVAKWRCILSEECAGRRLSLKIRAELHAREYCLRNLK